MNKQKIIIRLFILTAIATLVTGCTTIVDPLVRDNSQKVLDNANSISQLTARVQTLEDERITAADLIGTKGFKVVINTTAVTTGCPSDYDVRIKWFEAKERGDIDEEQYDKIKNKYNSEECQ